MPVVLTGMDDDTTRLIISIETILKDLARTLAGLSKVEAQLKRLANIKTTTTGLDKSATSVKALSDKAEQLGRSHATLSASTERVLATQTALRQSLQATQQQSTKTKDELGEDADAHVRDFRRIQKETREATERMVGFGNSLRSIGQGLTSAGFTLSAILTAPLIALGTASTEASITLDSLKRGLTAITGSSQEAGRQLERLTEIAKLPGIGFQEAIQGSIRLQAVGFSAKDAERGLREFSNAIALTGGGRDELNRVTVQLGQLSAKGKVLSQDLRPIIEAAPAVGTALKKAFGTVNADDIAKLTDNSQQFFNVLVAQLEQLPRAAGGAKNSFENFRDSVFRASTALGDALIPILTKLANVALPIIEAVADGFRALPFPVQATVVVIGALLAVLGPVLIIVGQLTVGVGRLTVGFAQLKLQAGEAATSVEALGVASASARTAVSGIAQGFAKTIGIIGIVIGVVDLLVSVYQRYNKVQAKTIEIDKDQLAAQDDQVKSLQQQIGFLGSLKDRVTRTADEQEKLREIYEQLNVQAKARVEGIKDETERNAQLRVETERLLKLKQAERNQQTANLAGVLADNVLLVDASNKEIDSITARIQANADLVSVLRQANKLTVEQSQQLARQGINAGNVEDAIGGLNSESENLVKTQEELRKETDDVAKVAKEQAQFLQLAGIKTKEEAREVLTAAQNMGVFHGSIEQVLQLLPQYTTATQDATRAVKDFLAVTEQQKSDLLKSGEAADKLQQERRAQIRAAAANARESTHSFDDALKSFQKFVAAQPQLNDALKREAEITGKSVAQITKEALDSAFERSKDSSGTALRNAQERLQQQLTQVGEAGLAKRLADEKQANDDSLRANELSFRGQLSSYREYLEARALLTGSSIDKEIARQTDLAKNARTTQARLLQDASKAGVPPAERVNRQAQAAKAEEDAIKAETKLVELESQRRDVANQLKIDLAELARQQEDDTRQLEIEYAELQGRIEDAFKAQTTERFRKQLIDLGNDQKATNERLNSSVLHLTAEEREELKVLQERNQREIDRINFLQKTLDATATLKTAEQFVSDSKRDQADLEEQLRIDVEFRGKTEQDAIRERLAGEDKLKQRMLVSRDIVLDTINQLKALDIKVPKAFTDFVNEVNLQAQILGKLSFSEQFRLANEEFDKSNDQRIRAIDDVDRAVKRRTISETQGILQIREINKKYLEDLRRQADLLEEIAVASNNPDLLRQAHQLQDEIKDANTELEDFSTELRSVSIDALQSGFEDFFASLSDQTKTAKEKLLDLVNSVANTIERFIAKRLSERLIESLFGTGARQGNLLGGLFGGGGQGAVGGAGAAVGQAAAGAGATTASATLITGATTAAASLATGAATAAAAFSTGVGAGVASLVAGIATAGASFAATVAAAGAAFAAEVTAAGAAGGLGGLGGGGGGGGDAATGLFPAVPGGAIHVVEGGYPEAILTTDPKHAVRQAVILREYLKQTKGLFGRLPSFAKGGFVTARDVESQMLSSLNRRTFTPDLTLGGAEPASAQNSSTSLRILNLFDRRRVVGDHLRSAEGARDILNIVSENSDEVGRRLGIR